MVERRPYFIFGDGLACAVIGAASGSAASAIVGESWSMLGGMVAGMAAGMALALLLGFALFFWLFGAMEVMVPTMLTGMVAGMAIGMAAAMIPIGWRSGVGAGALIGWACLALTYLANARLSGKVAEWTS